MIRIELIFVPFEHQLNRRAVVFQRRLAETKERKNVVCPCAVLNTLLKVSRAGLDERNGQLVVPDPAGFLERGVEFGLPPMFDSVG